MRYMSNTVVAEVRRYRLQVRNQLDRQAYEAAWQDSLAHEPGPFRRQHGVGIRVCCSNRSGNAA